MMEQKSFRRKEQAFNVEKFRAPDKEYSLITSWAWNAPVTREETDRQLDKFARLGIKIFYILPEPKTFRPREVLSTMEPDYLTKPYFEEYKYALEGAFKRGMIAMIYDEGGWPSGSACGKVLLKHPEYARQLLGREKKEVKAGEPYLLPENYLAAYIGKNRVYSGQVFETDTVVEEYFIRRNIFTSPGNADFPDITRKEATDAFIEMTYEGYKPYLQEYFGKEIFAVFTDEPDAPKPFPLRKELIEEYEKRYGEDISPYYPAMANMQAETDEEARAMIRWYDMSSEYFCKNYMLVQKEWCNRHGLEYTGHMNLDHIPQGSAQSAGNHLLRALRCFDIPGIDVIWRQIYPECCEDTQMGGYNNRFFPRYASSAAAQIGKDETISEVFGVYGNIPFEEMRWAFGFQAVRGITILQTQTNKYGNEGFQMASFSPLFTETHACYADAKTLIEYVERLSYITALGERDVSLALYMPMNDIWSGVNKGQVCDEFEKAGFELEESNLYFDVFDDDVMRDCDEVELTNGVVKMGKARYSELVITACKYMPESTKSKLETFIKGGGKVYTLPNAPEIKGSICVKNCVNLVPATLKFVGDSSFVRVYDKVLESGKMSILFNQSFAGENEVAVQVGEEKVSLIDITAGKVRALENEKGVVKFCMRAGETVALLFADERSESLCLKEETVLDSEYTFRKTKQFVIGEMLYYYDEIVDEERKIALGDWREVVGEAFSGSGVYKTAFKKPEIVGDTVALDCGKVLHTCEAFLNGKSLGVRVFTPYAYEIPSALLQEENVLEIRVSNTPANELKYTKSFDKWAKWQFSTYAELSNEFDKSCLAGGLFGPVKLKY